MQHCEILHDEKCSITEGSKRTTNRHSPRAPNISLYALLKNVYGAVLRAEQFYQYCSRQEHT